MEEKAKKIAELLKLLANEQRLLILCALMHGRKNVSEIHGHTPNITASALSQHLNLLKTAGILSSEKQGMNVTIRREMGSDIDAACGQLRQNYMNEETK